MTICIFLIINSFFIAITFHMLNVRADESHTNANVKINWLSDHGRVKRDIYWNIGSQTVRDTMFGFIGLVIDQSNYDHTFGAENIADPYTTPFYTDPDDFTTQRAIALTTDGEVQRSTASFINTNTLTGDPNDIFINQSVWTVNDKDWAILQWTLTNVRSPSATLNNVCISLELPLSQVGGRGGVGGNALGDGGDDVDGFDTPNAVYWARDTDSGTTFGVSSVTTSDPVNHYYAQDYHADYSSEYINFFENDTWLYERIHAANATATDGINPGNITTTVGWNGTTLLPGESRTFTYVIAVNDSYDNMIFAINDARDYYKNVLTGYLLTEIRDSGSATPRIEVFNFGNEPTNPIGILELHSAKAGGPLTGNWIPNTIPTYGYSYFEPAETIDIEGDTIYLYEDGILIDHVTYGQMGTAPDPLNGESLARKFNPLKGSYDDIWLRNASTGPSWGADNIGIGSIITSPNVVINQVLFNPFSGDEEEGYVEIMYTGMAQMDISDFKIVCDDEFIIPQGTILDLFNRFFVLTYSDFPGFFTNMDASGDNIYLYDDNGDLFDMVGWSSQHFKGRFMARATDGVGTNQGFDDATSMAAGWIFDQEPYLLITEFSADDSTTARVELYNPRGGDKVLTTRWTLDVDLGTLSGTWNTPGEIISSGDYAFFDRNGGAILDADGDSISLYYNTTTLMEQVAFGTRGVASDPLVGESTARYWDGNIPGYSVEWTRNGTSGPSWGAQNDVSPINPSPSVILNEVMFDTSAANGKYFVLMNLGPVIVDVADYSLVCDAEYRLPNVGSIDIDPFEKRIFRYDDDPASIQFFDSMDFDADNVYLYDLNGELLDMVGWNSAHTTDMSVRRVPDGSGTYQGHDDTTSQAADWFFDSPFELLITEISDSDSTLSQIEIYNPWYPPINYNSGFTMENKSVLLSGIWSSFPAGIGEYAVFEVTTLLGLDSQGDTATLYQNGVLIDEISYGTLGTVPDPIPNESTERYWQGTSYSDVWERNWTTGPNFGAQNDVPPDNLSSSVVLNEVLFNPIDVNNHFVEICYTGNRMVNLSGYKLVCNSEYIFPDGTLLFSDDRLGYLLYGTDNAFFQNMISSGDNVYLYDSNGAIV
ncbi:MAG: lamin tail domain-containing protein, partial [Methanomassiliicoccales archaeon]